MIGFNRFIQNAKGNDPTLDDVDDENPGGSNVGIIRDPFGAAQLVAATRNVLWCSPIISNWHAMTHGCSQPIKESTACSSLMLGDDRHR